VTLHALPVVMQIVCTLWRSLRTPLSRGLPNVFGAALCSYHAWRVHRHQIARDNAGYARLATFPDASTVTTQQASRIFTSSATSFNQLTRLTTSRAVLVCRNLDNDGQVCRCLPVCLSVSPSLSVCPSCSCEASVGVVCCGLQLEGR
jgi:hypothetical protein